MSDVDRLFEQYRREHREGGEADPRQYLEQLEGVDRRELEALIDGYLMRAPGREWDAEAFQGSPAQRAADAIAASWGDEEAIAPVAWRELLPQLRERAQMKRTELVERLADAIGAAGQADKVRAYYHRMETGKLPSEGVSDRVLDALGSIVGETRERLRAAGSAIAAGGSAESARTATVMARKAVKHPEYETAEEAAPAAAPAPADEEAADEDDEVDRLFTGGPAAGD